MRFQLIYTLALVGLGHSESLSLQSAMREALLQSPQMQILKENRAYSEALVQEVGSVVYPKIEFNASAGVGQSPLGIKSSGSSSKSGFDLSKLSGDKDSLAVAKSLGYVGQLMGSAFKFDTDPRSNYRWGFTLSQPLYTFGKLSTAIAVSKYQDTATLQQYKRGRQEIQISVVEAYAGLVMAGKAQSILERSAKRSQELRDFLKRNFELGSGSKADLLRADAALTQIQVRMSESSRDVLRAQMALNQVLGRPLDQEIVVDTSLVQFPWMNLSNRSEKELVQSAKEQRADLKALHMQGKIYAGGEKIDRAAYLPSIALQAKAGITGYDEFKNAIDPDNRDWSVGIGLNWTLFDGFGSKAKATEKRIQARILDQQALQLQRQIQTETSRLLRESEVALQNQKAMEQMQLALSESMDLTQREFKSGKGILSDLLGLEESLSQTQLALLQAKWQEIRAKAQLNYVLGQDLVGE